MHNIKKTWLLDIDIVVVSTSTVLLITFIQLIKSFHCIEQILSANCLLFYLCPSFHAFLQVEVEITKIYGWNLSLCNSKNSTWSTSINEQYKNRFWFELIVFEHYTHISTSYQTNCQTVSLFRREVNNQVIWRYLLTY